MKKYKYSTIFAPLSIIAEVLLEISIPVLMSRIVDIGIPRQDLAYIVKIGLLMVLMAILGMFAGALSSRLAAKASMGFASELRNGLFKSVQSFSFSNIDRFSSASRYPAHYRRNQRSERVSDVHTNAGALPRHADRSHNNGFQH